MVGLETAEAFTLKFASSAVEREKKKKKKEREKEEEEEEGGSLRIFYRLSAGFIAERMVRRHCFLSLYSLLPYSILNYSIPKLLSSVTRVSRNFRYCNKNPHVLFLNPESNFLKLLLK